MLQHMLELRSFGRSQASVRFALLLGWVGASLVACSAGELEGGDEPPPFGVGSVGGASANVPVGPAAGAGGALGSSTPTGGSAGASTVGGEVTPQGPLGAGNAPSAVGGAGGAGSNVGSAGQAGGAPDDGQAGDGSDEEPPPPGVVGRAGAELCPPGPFGDPLPANPQVTKLFSVGENNFFNFEGPVWVGNALYFSEISGGNNPPPSRIHRFVPGGMLERGVIANTGSNGLGVDAQGNLIAATHDNGAISRFQLPGGARSAVGAQTFNGTRFNSPNDLVMRNDGNVYFTDPSFQAPGNPQGQTRVYRLPPQGEATVVDANLSNPNGITLSPDGNTLYVTAAGRLVRYELAADGTPGPGTDIQLADGLQTPDGMAVDCAGNIYATEHFRRLIRVIDPDGNQIGSFGGNQAFDRDITNLAFGGPNRTTLFVTTLTQGDQGGVFSVELNIPGLPY